MFEWTIIVEYYQRRPEELVEDAELVIAGEDPEDGLAEGEKPIRLLSDFSIFDPKHRNEFMSLAAIEEDDGVDRQFECAGMVMPYFVSEEDEGQDEETEIDPQYVRLGAILRYTIDYTQESECAISFFFIIMYDMAILSVKNQKAILHRNGIRLVYFKKTLSKILATLSALLHPAPYCAIGDLFRFEASNTDLGWFSGGIHVKSGYVWEDLSQRALIRIGMLLLP
jgi:hypothetical protein